MTGIPKIIPPSGRFTMEQLDAELETHLVEAQRHYEAALRAHDSGESSQHLFNLAIVEQNAALLCEQRINRLVLSRLW